MSIVKYIDKINKKLNKRFPDNGNLTSISFEVNNPFGVCELVLKIDLEDKKGKSRKICSIAYIPDGLIDDGENQAIERRDFNSKTDMVEYTFNSISDNSLETITTIKYATMRLEKIYKDLRKNGKYYNGIIINYKKIKLSEN